MSQRLYTAAQIRQLEAEAIQGGQLSEADLMAAAGLAAWQCLEKYWAAAQRIVVVCGQGNNGGDGYVLAKHASEAGKQVTVLQVGNQSQSSAVAKQAAKACQASQCDIQHFDSTCLLAADVVVDAVLGIGVNREVSGEYQEAIDAINQAQTPILALDIPSGLDANTGSVHGIAVRADRTISFIGLKTGLMTGQGPTYGGECLNDDLGISQEALSAVPTQTRLLDLSDLLMGLVSRAQSSHKGEHGHVLVVGGELGMGGAARMAAEAALYVGAGKVSVATRAEHITLISGQRPEIMTHAVDTPEALIPLLKQATVVVLGPGLGQAPWAQTLASLVLQMQDKQVLVDADGLNYLAGHSVKRDNWVLTPHPGEAARLLQCDTTVIQHNRYQAIDALQKKYSGVVLLKGAGSLIKAQDDMTFVCPYGSPAMAVAGMGDVLSGMIAGLMAQGYVRDYATKLAVSLHACAGEQLARAQGERGLLALELLPIVRALLNNKQ